MLGKVLKARKETYDKILRSLHPTQKFELVLLVDILMEPVIVMEKDFCPSILPTDKESKFGEIGEIYGMKVLVVNCNHEVCKLLVELE